MKTNKIPDFQSRLHRHIVSVPEIISECSGLRVFGQLLKSFLFSTDVAIIRNTNADAIIAVYPFTPQPAISHALILAADKPIFCGVGGGITTGDRSIELALDAEFQGALGVVLNKPTPNDLIRRLKDNTIRRYWYIQPEHHHRLPVCRSVSQYQPFAHQ